jgi:CPA1 family monovalent cation:H+ antiporter
VNQFLLAQLEVVKFQRELLLKFQTEGDFSEEALTKAERELDIEEMRINSLMQKLKHPQRLQQTGKTINLTIRHST